MKKTWTFESEPGIIITAEEFGIVHKTWVEVDEDGAEHEFQYEWHCGREVDSCAWFFVPYDERVRLESEGAVFRDRV